MGRRKDFFEEYASDSDDNSDEELRLPGEDDEVDPTLHRRKRRRTGRDAKEAAALGVFGSESEDERPAGNRKGWKAKNLREKGVGFVGAGGAANEEEDDDDDDEEDEDARPGLGGFAGLRGGLGFTPAKGAAEEPSKEDEVEERPRGLGFGTPLGQGFVSSAATARAQMPDINFTPPQSGASTPTVRPSAFMTPGASKGKAPAGPNPESFAARMMAKMGYVQGKGLGKSGDGRVAPVETKLRPQGAGLGAVREMTETERQERKRAAALRGEVLSDSDDEKKRRRKKKGVSGGSTPSGNATPSRTKKEKTKFRTAEEISATAKGLDVPSALKNIIDYTGKDAKLLSSASGLMAQTPTADDRSLQLAKAARRDLELYAKEWKGLQDRKAYVENEESRLSVQLDEQVAELQRMQEMVKLVKELQGLSVTGGSDKGLEAVVSQLEVLQFEYKNEIETQSLSEAAVAALHPIFRSHLTNWKPLEDPFCNSFVDYFRRLRPILNVRSKDDLEKEYTLNGYIERSKQASPYETMIATLWLPKIRSTINNDWDVHKPAPLLSLLEVWSAVLPAFIQASLLSQLILPKLRTAVSKWNPRKEKRRRSQPHTWLFQWLPHLGTHMDDIVRDMRTKFGVVLDTWDLNTTSTDPLGLAAWREVFGSEKLENTLIRHLLPRLALRLRQDFEVYPPDQVLAPLEDVFKWAHYFKASTLARLLDSEFFPKWLNVLHQWLTSPEPVFTEVQEWYVFWQDVFPEELRGSPLVKEGFRKGLDMMNDALDLGERAAVELPAPMAGPQPPIKESTTTTTTSRNATPAKQKVEQETTFRDVVEDWCAEHNLLLVPLRKAHEGSGLPLFRITASASGAGGVMVYFRGDVVWVQERKRKEVFEPMGLGEVLVRLEGGHK